LSEASEDDIHWQYKEGIVKNFSKIKQEFMTFRGYKQTKILLIGPPSSGKTEISRRLN
jgi:hypothetical protein